MLFTARSFHYFFILWFSYYTLRFRIHKIFYSCDVQIEKNYDTHLQQFICIYITNECNNKILHLDYKYAHKYRPACPHSHNTHSCILVKTEDVSGIFTVTNDVHIQGLPHSLPNDMLLLCIKGSSKSLEGLLRCFRMERTARTRQLCRLVLGDKFGCIWIQCALDKIKHYRSQSFRNINIFITIKCLINCKSQSSCEILVSQFLVIDEDSSLQGHYAPSTGEWSPMFWRSILPLFSGSSSPRTWIFKS